MVRYADSVGIIHADHALGIDYTLCGIALEEDEHGGEMTVSSAGQITCVNCTVIIQHCWSIQKSALYRCHDHHLS